MLKLRPKNFRRVSLTDAIVFFYTLYAFYALNPYFTWKTFWGGAFGYSFGAFPIRSLFALIACGLGIFYILRTNKKSRDTSLSGFTLLLVAFVFLVICGGDNNSPIDTSWVSFLSIAVFLFLPRKIQCKTLRSFTTLFVITLIPSLFFYIFADIIGINVPFTVLSPDDVAKITGGAYYKHRLLSVQLVTPVSVINRFYGIYYEAGVVGTVSALLLGVNNYDFLGKGKWKEKTLLLAGICSISLSFILLTVIYYVTFNITQHKFKNAAWLIALALIYITFISVPFNSPVLSNVQSRLSIVDYSLQGDNRTSTIYISTYETIFRENTWIQLFGHGRDSFSYIQGQRGFDGSSYKSIIYDYGFIGFGLYILWFVLCTLNLSYRNSGKLLYFLPILFMQLANIYQKPDIFPFYCVIIFVGGLAMQVSERSKTEISQVLSNNNFEYSKVTV